MRYLLIILVSFVYMSINAQELNCNVTVNSSRISGTNKQVFISLQESLNNFMNNTVWTNYVYEGHERIECNILLDISEQVSADEFKGKLQIQARRPVYGSSYNTVIINYIDNDVQFKYQEFDPLEVSENTYVSNLSSLLTYYAYLIIGLDGDTFSNKGGEIFFRKAEKIVNNAQSSGYIGWQGGDSKKRKNRYWLIDNLLDSDYEVLRDFSYSYHRQGLDLMEKSIERGRAGAVEAISLLERFNKNKPDPFTYLLTVILDSKSDEFVNVFAEASANEKQRIRKILTEIDPAGGRKYDKLNK